MMTDEVGLRFLQPGRIDLSDGDRQTKLIAIQVKSADASREVTRVETVRQRPTRRRGRQVLRIAEAYGDITRLGKVAEELAQNQVPPADQPTSAGSVPLQSAIRGKNQSLRYFFQTDQASSERVSNVAATKPFAKASAFSPKRNGTPRVKYSADFAKPPLNIWRSM